MQFRLWIKNQVYKALLSSPVFSSLHQVHLVIRRNPDYCYVIASFAYTKTKMAAFNLNLPIFDALLLAI